MYFNEFVSSPRGGNLILLADQEVYYFQSLSAQGKADDLMDVACLNVVADVSVGNGVETLSSRIVD